MNHSDLEPLVACRSCDLTLTGAQFFLYHSCAAELFSEILYFTVEFPNFCRRLKTWWMVLLVLGNFSL